MLGARVGHTCDQVKHDRQEEPEEENADKQLRLPVNQKEENHRNSDCDNRIVLNEGNNAIHKSSCLALPAPLRAEERMRL